MPFFKQVSELLNFLNNLASNIASVLYITYRDHLTETLFWISYICVYVYVRVYLCLMDVSDLFFIIIFIFIITNHVMSLKQKCLFPIKNLAPGCCLEFA